jgi:hypothetical protein
MCNIVLTIEDPETNSEKKYDAAVEELSKALKITKHDHKDAQPESTPYKSLRQLTDSTIDLVEKGLAKILSQIMIQFFGTVKKSQDDSVEELSKSEKDEPFKIHKKMVINPHSGMPLTIAEWNAIKKEITKVFSYLYGQTDQMILNRAMALGKLLQTMPIEESIAADYDKIKHKLEDEEKKAKTSDSYQNAYDFAEMHTGELIQDMTERSRKAVVNTILDAQKNKLSIQQTEQKLRDSFGTLNRDWQRIAVTESANNFNNGYLLSEASTRIKGEHVFMRGISAPNACGFCKTHVNGKVVVLLDDAPQGEDDKIEIDGKEYTAIYPGKSNYGRSSNDWWVSSGSQHPRCRCSWVRYNIGMEKYYEMLDDAVAKQSQKNS